MHKGYAMVFLIYTQIIWYRNLIMNYIYVKVLKLAILLKSQNPSPRVNTEGIKPVVVASPPSPLPSTVACAAVVSKVVMFGVVVVVVVVVVVLVGHSIHPVP